MYPKDKPYLTRVWPYLLAVAVLGAVSIDLGRYCLVEREPEYRVNIFLPAPL